MAVSNAPAILDHDLCTELSNCVTNLTTNGNKTLDQRLLKTVKQICRHSDDYVEHVYHLVMTQMQKEHSEIRYSALLITDELFQRSHKFRTFLLADFQDFLQLCAETDPEEPLPPPKAAANNLKLKALECVQRWYQHFKDGYKLLVIAYNYLRECKQVNFEDLEARTVAENVQQAIARQRQENLLMDKVDRSQQEINDLTPEIESVCNQLRNCLRLLQPHPEVFFDQSDFEAEQNKESHTEITDVLNSQNNREFMRQHGMGSRSVTIKVDLSQDSGLPVEENEDTSVILDNIRDLHHQIVTRFQPVLSTILQVFTKAGCQDKMKRAIDLKQILQSCVEEVCELKIIKNLPGTYITKKSDSDEEDFEEVKEKEGVESTIPVHRRHEYGLEPVASTSKYQPTVSHSQRHWDLSIKAEELKDPTTRLANISALCQKLTPDKGSPDKARSTSHDSQTLQKLPSQTLGTKRKAELLSKAPKKNFDIDLFHWEEENLEAPNVIRFDSLHKFWQPRENETSEFQDKEGVAALRRRVIDFSGEFQPVKWACRAPLPSGKLCPRQDRRKCPLHGLVIPRDNMGRSSNPEDQPSFTTSKAGTSSSNVPDWQEPELLRDLEAATGIDLTMPQKGRRRKKKTKTEGGLTNIKVTQNTTRKRLERRVLNKNSVRRVADTLDTLDHKKFSDKFGNQWNYSFST